MGIEQDPLVDHISVNIPTANSAEVSGLGEAVEREKEDGWVGHDPTPKGHFVRKYMSKIELDTHREAELGAHEGMWCIKVFHGEKKPAISAMHEPG